MLLLKLRKLKEIIFKKIKITNLRIIRILKVICSRIYLRILSIDLKVPNWHLNATFHAREYKSKVIKILHRFSSYDNCFIEVGCGTGDLISRINIEKKLGIDIDKNVLSLCNRLHPEIDTICVDIFSEFNTLKNFIENKSNKKITFVVMINWLHMYSETKANLLIERILSINNDIFVLTDIYSRPEFSIKADNKVKHNFNNLPNVKWHLDFKNIDKVRDINLVSNFVPEEKIIISTNKNLNM